MGRNTTQNIANAGVRPRIFHPLNHETKKTQNPVVRTALLHCTTFPQTSTAPHTEFSWTHSFSRGKSELQGDIQIPTIPDPMQEVHSSLLPQLTLAILAGLDHLGSIRKKEQWCSQQGVLGSWWSLCILATRGIRPEKLVRSIRLKETWSFLGHRPL